MPELEPRPLRAEHVLYPEFSPIYRHSENQPNHFHMEQTPVFLLGHGFVSGLERVKAADWGPPAMWVTAQEATQTLRALFHMFFM